MMAVKLILERGPDWVKVRVVGSSLSFLTSGKHVLVKYQNQKKTFPYLKTTAILPYLQQNTGLGANSTHPDKFVLYYNSQTITLPPLSCRHGPDSGHHLLAPLTANNAIIKNLLFSAVLWGLPVHHAQVWGLHVQWDRPPVFSPDLSVSFYHFIFFIFCPVSKSSGCEYKLQRLRCLIRLKPISLAIVLYNVLMAKKKKSDSDSI